MPPDSASLGMSIVLAVAVCGVAWILAEARLGPPMVLAFIAVFLIWLFPYQGYKEADRHWSAVTNALASGRVSLVTVTYFRGDEDERKTYYIRQAFNHAANIPKFRTEFTDRATESCELDVVMEGISRSEAGTLRKALIDVFSCKTKVTRTA